MPLPVGSVRVEVPELLRSYRRDVIDDLLEESKLASTSSAAGATSRTARGLSPDNHGRRDPGLAERAAAQRAAREAEQKAKDEDFRRKTERKMVEANLLKEQEFQGMYQDVLEGLSNTTGIMGDTQYTLEHSARIKNAKKKDLYQEWDTEVFTKMQERLQRSIDARSSTAIEQRLNTQMSDYLHTTNTKLGVFRDVIIEEDYNPLRVHQATIQIPTGDIKDPLKRDVLKTLHEQQLMGISAHVPTELGKQTLDPKVWGELAIKASPYGHCMDETGNYIVRPTSGSVNKTRESRVPMDHYGFPNFDNQAALAEAGRQGKSTAAVAAGAAAGLFGVLQQTAGNGPSGGTTNKDAWIDYKGRGMPPGPEQRRGRQGLGEIIMQGSNPYQDGRTLGDQWLEAKGKLMPPGPEMRRGRPNLTEIFQQTSNPYEDGRSLGDTWLEAKGKRNLAGASVTIGPVISSTRGEPQPVIGGKAMPPTDKRHVSSLVADKTLTTRNLTTCV